MPRRRPEFEPGAAEAAKYKIFSDASGFKFSSCPMSQKQEVSSGRSIVPITGASFSPEPIRGPLA